MKVLEIVGYSYDWIPKPFKDNEILNKIKEEDIKLKDISNISCKNCLDANTQSNI